MYFALSYYRLPRYANPYTPVFGFLGTGFMVGIVGPRRVAVAALAGAGHSGGS